MGYFIFFGDFASCGSRGPSQIKANHPHFSRFCRRHFPHFLRSMLQAEIIYKSPVGNFGSADCVCCHAGSCTCQNWANPCPAVGQLLANQIFVHPLGKRIAAPNRLGKILCTELLNC